LEKIGIVTITYNSENVLDDFFKSILIQTHDNFELFLIDNCSSDNTLNILESIDDSRVHIIKEKINLGVAAANNKGINEAISNGCSQVLLINNDVEFENQLISKLLKAQRSKIASLVTPKMMYYENPNRIWYAGAWFSKKKGYIPLHRGMNEKDSGKYNQIEEVEYAPTCCLLIKKEVFTDIGLMDEKYFVYFDDTDFAYRVLKHGQHKMYYVPDIQFYHKVGSLTKSTLSDNNKIYRGKFFIQQTVKNHVYFLKKIGGGYAFLHIVFLFFKNNLRFFTNTTIRKNFSTFWLINKSYFQGLFL